jgi:hypothetical protein
VRPEPVHRRRQRPTAEVPECDGQLTLDFSERVDPDAADALWAAVFGAGPGVAPDAGGVTAAPGPDGTDAPR